MLLEEIKDLTYKKYDRDFDYYYIVRTVINICVERYGYKNIPVNLSFTNEEGKWAHTTKIKTNDSHIIEIFMPKDLETYKKTYNMNCLTNKCIMLFSGLINPEDFIIAEIIYITLHEFYHNVLLISTIESGLDVNEFNRYLYKINKFTNLASRSHKEISNYDLMFEETYANLNTLVNFIYIWNKLVKSGYTDLYILKSSPKNLNKDKFNIKKFKSLLYKSDLELNQISDFKDILKKIDYRKIHLNKINFNEGFYNFLKSDLNITNSKEELVEIVHMILKFYHGFVQYQFADLQTIINFSNLLPNDSLKKIPFHGDWELMYIVCNAMYLLMNLCGFSKEFE